MYYPASFEKNTKGFHTVVFRDIPKDVAYGKDFADAFFVAQNLLLVTLDCYLDNKRIILKDRFNLLI